MAYWDVYLRFFFFFLQVLISENFSLKTFLTVSHKLCFFFIHLDVFHYLVISSLVIGYWMVSNLWVSQQLISYLAPFLLENILCWCMISFFFLIYYLFYVLTYGLSWTMFHVCLRRTCILLLLALAFYRCHSTWFSKYIALFKSIFFLILSLGVPSITGRGILTIIIESSISASIIFIFALCILRLCC